MKNELLIAIIILLLGVSCNKTEDHYPGTYPCCLQPFINSILSSPPTMPRVRVLKHYYNEQYLYVWENMPIIADLSTIMVDENCQIVCEFGGLTGLSTCDWEDIEFIEVAWEDPR